MVCKKFITGIMCCLCAFLLMSHNVSAIEASDSSNVVLFGSSNPTCRYLMNSSTYSSWTNDVSPTYGINVDWAYIDTWQCRAGNSSGNFSLNAGDIVEVYWWVRDNDPISNDSFYQGSGALQRWQYDANFRIVSAEIVGQISNINDRYTYWRGILVLNNNFIGSSITVPVQQSTTNVPSGQTSWVRTLGWTAYRPKAGTDYSTSINDIKNKLDTLNENVQQQQQQEEDAVQDAADNAQDSADDAQSDSEAATSSLLSVITGFFGAMANLNPTNCKFDSHLPFLSGNGEIDLCQVPAHPIVQTIGSLILIGIMVPFAIHMYNRFVSITGSFQR